MRMGFISDLHVDNFTYEVQDYIEVLSEIISKNELEMLVIGGDITNSYKTTSDFVEELQDQTKIQVYFIPGNHDLWDRVSDREDINTRSEERRVGKEYQSTNHRLH